MNNLNVKKKKKKQFGAFYYYEIYSEKNNGFKEWVVENFRKLF